MTFKWTPDAWIKDDPLPEQRVNANFQRMATAHQTLDGTAIKAPTLGGGFVLDSGSVSITGSKTGIATKLSSITSVLVSLSGSAATNFWVEAQVTPSNSTAIDIYVWMPTAAGNTTPIAATSAITVNWLAIGTSTATQ